MSENYYEILGVARDADIRVIQDAAQARLQDLKLRMQDRRMNEANARAEAQKTKEIFAVLKDPAQREAYDRTLPPLPVENPYRAPSADLEQKNRADANIGGNLEDAVNGNYQLEFRAIFTQAWESTYGFKGQMWLAILVMWMMFFGLLVGLGFIASLSAGANVFMQVGQIFVNIISYPLTAGLIMMGIRRAAELDVSFMEVFNYFAYTLKLLVAAIIMSFFIALPIVLAISASQHSPFGAILALPAIYLFPAYFFTFPLLTEKKLGIWAALECSRKAVTHHWLSVVLIYLGMVLIFFISIIPLGIGLIWTMPMMFTLHGVMYRTIFGVSQD
jgi:hypothetical protein